MDGAARVLLISDDPLARGGLHALLSGQAGITVVGQVAADELPGAIMVDAWHNM